MPYEASVLRRAARRLEEERERRAGELERRRAEIYRTVPRIAEIDRQLRGTVPKVVAAALRQGSDPAPAIAAVRTENLRLQSERAALLEEQDRKSVV